VRKRERYWALHVCSVLSFPLFRSHPEPKVVTMSVILRLLLMVIVVRCQPLDLNDFGITWDLPIPTGDTVTQASVTLTPSILDQITVPLIGMPPAIVTPNEVVQYPKKVANVTMLVSTVMPVTRSYSQPSVPPVPLTRTANSSLVPLSAELSLGSAPLRDNKFFRAPRVVYLSNDNSEPQFDSNLFTDVPLPYDEQTTVPSAGTNSAVSPVTISLEEMENEMEQLEADVDHMDYRGSNSTTINPNHVNIWIQASDFLATHEGLAFVLTLLALGKKFFS